MHVRFAPNLEYPFPMRPRNVVGETTLGAAGLIRTLEVQLGLPPVLPRPAEALFAYRACLADADDLARFYHTSFATDAIGTTQTLLSWRSRWYEAGWTGSFDTGAPLRLGDMAAVEALARGRVPRCGGERLARIRAALDAGMTTQIDSIELHAAPNELSAAWRAVLAHFETTVAAGTWPPARAPATTDLERVQARLQRSADGARGLARERLSGDGTVMILRAVSRDLSAQAVAEYLLRHGTEDVCVLAERDGIIVDNAFERVGLPRAGFQHYTPFRAVHQVLKLALSLLWRPMSAELLLQFFAHPEGPLPRRVRGDFAEAMAEEPGVGGRRWSAVLEKSVARDPALKSEIAYWLEGERFDETTGAPPRVLAERARRVRSWLTTRRAVLESEADRVLYATAIVQSEGLATALERLAVDGRTRMSKVELDLILNDVISRAGDPATVAQAGHVSAATRAGEVTETYGTVVWWDLNAHAGDVTYPWSLAEIEYLRNNAVLLPAPAERVVARSREWLRPILNARQRLLLVVHTREEGAHPVLGQIHGAFDGVPEWRVEHALLESTPTTTLAPEPLELSARALERRALPTRKRWWTLPPGSLNARDYESYSSLSKLLDQPHGWVLRYAARLRSGRAAKLASGGKLYGNLAHRLIETFFLEHPDWRSEGVDARQWAAVNIPRLIEREGATLLERGSGVERERVTLLLERALERLVDHLRATQFAIVRPEVDATAPFADTRLQGAIDLVLSNQEGRETVLDVKWGGEQWRLEELTASRYLQLATYAYLRRKATGSWPGVGFFIVTTTNVLAQHDDVFANAVIPSAPSNERVEDLWQRLDVSYAWRRKQLDGGLIEIVADDTQPDDRSVAPFDGLGPRKEPDPFDDFVWLTGIAS